MFQEREEMGQSTFSSFLWKRIDRNKYIFSRQLLYIYIEKMEIIKRYVSQLQIEWCTKIHSPKCVKFLPLPVSTFTSLIGTCHSLISSLILFFPINYLYLKKQLTNQLINLLINHSGKTSCTSLSCENLLLLSIMNVFGKESSQQQPFLSSSFCCLFFNSFFTWQELNELWKKIRTCILYQSIQSSLDYVWR